jgi:hypothetical protein
MNGISMEMNVWSSTQDACGDGDCGLERGVDSK